MIRRFRRLTQIQAEVRKKMSHEKAQKSQKKKRMTEDRFEVVLAF